jgi:hypothetical protein
MRIRKKFLKLTNYTYPYGTEGFLKGFLPQGYQEDGHGNYYYLIGDNPSTMFTCHLDTACKEQERVKHVFSGNMIMTDGKTILGADDKAGMVVVLNMIEKKVPGLYFFFIGEEVGCIGSGLLADNWDKFPHSKSITKVVSFDRRGTSSVITHQFWGRCCSDEFGKILAGRLSSTNDKLMLDIDDTGVMTDSAKFMGLVQECTNISVGYYNEHTFRECQNIDYLQILCDAVVQIDWETLPIVRNIEDIDFEEEDEYDYIDSDDFEMKDEYEEQFFSHFKYKDGVKKMFISKRHISKERLIIWNWINSRCEYSGVSSFTWNGNSLHIDNEFVGNRVDLIDMISQLSSVPTSELSSVPTKRAKKILM